MAGIETRVMGGLYGEIFVPTKNLYRFFISLFGAKDPDLTRYMTVRKFRKKGL